jgi:hypothetical protein
MGLFTLERKLGPFSPPVAPFAKLNVLNDRKEVHTLEYRTLIVGVVGKYTC